MLGRAAAPAQGGCPGGAGGRAPGAPAGGPLLLSLHEGDGEFWQRWPGEDADRFFARYRAEEVDELLTGVGFTLLRRERDVTPAGKRWLCHLATAG